MDEKFSKLQVGDNLSASRMNRLGRVAERVAGFSTGSHLNIHHGSKNLNVSGLPPFHQNLLEVYAEEGVTAGLFYGRQRYYDYTTGLWNTDTLSDWLIDANGTDTSLSVGQNVTCFWDAMRGAFIPITSTAGVMVVDLVQDGGVAGSSTADCTYTYTVNSLSGTTLDTLVTPERARYPLCVYLPGNGLGLAAYVGGVLRLLVAWKEIEDTTVCEGESSESSSSLSVSVSSASSPSSVHSSASSVSSPSSMSASSVSSASSASWESHSSASSPSSMSASSASSLSSTSVSSVSSTSSGSSESSPSSMSASSTSSTISSSSASSESSLSSTSESSVSSVSSPSSVSSASSVSSGGSF